MLGQQVAAIPMDAVVVGGHLDECVPDGARIRHKGLVPDTACRRQLPYADEGDHRQQRQGGVGQPTAPLRRARSFFRCGGRFFGGNDVNEYRHYADSFLWLGATGRRQATAAISRGCRRHPVLIPAQTQPLKGPTQRERNPRRGGGPKSSSAPSPSHNPMTGAEPLGNSPSSSRVLSLFTRYFGL